MITLENILDISRVYKIDETEIDKIQERAKIDIEELLNPTLDHPPFFYYIILVHLKESRVDFDNCIISDKKRYAEETLNEIRRIWDLDVTKMIYDFLKNTWELNMPYRYRTIGRDNIQYETNKKHCEDFKTLCELLGLSYEVKELQEGRFQITIKF